ncbi:phosphatase PAP2 family protein [Sphingobium algorifonticola]|uniref:phosphatase PAP2 family protein n=1 Tax=Sphingobium algorifonticola TaxID=2008318 RepID=UPI0030BA0C15
MMLPRTLPLVLLVSALAMGAASWWAQGPLPGDVALTQAAQAFFGARPAWAEHVTTSATDPWMWGVMLACGLVAALVRNGATGVGIMIGFAVALAADRLLRLFLHVPRPTADLVAVAKPSQSSGLPSTFALVYGATVGIVMLLALARRDGTGRILAVVMAALLLAGCAARVTMGGHWPSQMVASVMLAMSLGLYVLRYGRDD